MPGKQLAINNVPKRNCLSVYWCSWVQREFVITGNSSVNGFSGWHWLTQWTALWPCLCYSFPIRFGLGIFFWFPNQYFLSINVAAWRCSNRCSHHSPILLVAMSVAPSRTLSQLHCKLVFTQFNACSVRQIIPLSQKHSTFPRSTSPANREGTYPFMAHSFDFKGEKLFCLRNIFINIASRLKPQIPG